VTAATFQSASLPDLSYAPALTASTIASHCQAVLHGLAPG
jgi:hypothetical protein